MARTNTYVSTSKLPQGVAEFQEVQKISHYHNKWIMDHGIADIASKSLNREDKGNEVELNRIVSNYSKNKANVLLLHPNNNYVIIR